jgi:hypothetical protein
MHKMNEADSRRLVVFDGGKMVGFITHTGVGHIVPLKVQLEGDAKPFGERRDMSKYQGYE